jgi:hypothetical protein
MASTSNKEILEHSHSKAFCMIVSAPSYMPNMVIQKDLHIHKSATTALIIVLTSHTQITYQWTSRSNHTTGNFEDTCQMI